MKWPRHVSIRGERYKVRLVTRREIPGLDGFYDPGIKEILVWRGLKGKMRWVTLLHELMHLAVGKGCGENGVSGTIEHQIINRMEEPLYEILNRNFGFGMED